MQVEESRWGRDKRKERMRLKTTVKSRMRQDGLVGLVHLSFISLGL